MQWRDNIMTDFTAREEVLIEATIERLLKRMPSVISNLMKEQAVHFKLNKAFYEENPQFIPHKDVVAKTIEQLDGENPAMDYKELLNKAIPIIQSRIGAMKGIDTKMISDRNQLNLSHIKNPSNSNGAI
jgi:hypothetical protein